MFLEKWRDQRASDALNFLQMDRTHLSIKDILEEKKTKHILGLYKVEVKNLSDTKAFLLCFLFLFAVSGLEQHWPVMWYTQLWCSPGMANFRVSCFVDMVVETRPSDMNGMSSGTEPLP